MEPGVALRNHSNISKIPKHGTEGKKETKLSPGRIPFTHFLKYRYTTKDTYKSKDMYQTHKRVAFCSQGGGEGNGGRNRDKREICKPMPRRKMACVDQLNVP